MSQFSYFGFTSISSWKVKRETAFQSSSLWAPLITVYGSSFSGHILGIYHIRSSSWKMIFNNGKVMYHGLSQQKTCYHPWFKGDFLRCAKTAIRFYLHTLKTSWILKCKWATCTVGFLVFFWKKFSFLTESVTLFWYSKKWHLVTLSDPKVKNETKIQIFWNWSWFDTLVYF